ncbi:MAG: mechanosensitive ion channel, partial [Eubacterium sp.]|nr:mechanosensitive ion channel [Eubacterium sp.]
MEKRNVDPAIRIFTISLIKYAVIIFMVVEIVQMLDIVKASSIAALIASAGVGISLAMQGTLSNFAGGILLLVLRPFRIGDYIVVPNSTAEGTVTKIEMYYTTLRTVDNEFVSIPNSELTNHQVTRYAEGEQRKLINRVTIAYSADLHLAKEILGRLIHEDKRYLRLQTVFVDELADSGVVLGCSGMVRADQYRIISWEMNERIKLAFDEAGIEIPFNQMDVHIIPESKNGEKE